MQKETKKNTKLKMKNNRENKLKLLKLLPIVKNNNLNVIVNLSDHP